jgi:hypothetical protein
MGDCPSHVAVLSAVRRRQRFALLFDESGECDGDRELSGMALRYASDELQNDKEIAMIANTAVHTITISIIITTNNNTTSPKQPNPALTTNNQKATRYTTKFQSYSFFNSLYSLYYFSLTPHHHHHTHHHLASLCH